MEIGSQIGPYRIDALLGRGGMAEVYKVWHTGLHRFEAMKVLPPQMTFDKSFVERFLNEARTAAGLQHPNIATIHTVSEPSCPQPYFTMEIVEGGDLADMLEARGRFSLNESLPVLQQIGAALDYAHGRGLMHRDVKPANVLLKPDGGGHAVKVVDFGIARAQEEAGGKRLTKTGMIVGTPEYMSPEQGGSGASVDHHTDQYSLGVIAYEMLCGAPPFKAQSDTSMLSVIMQHVRDEPRPPIEHIPTLSKAANAAILKALAKNPADRFDSCAAFLEALAGSTVVKKVKASTDGMDRTRRAFPLVPVMLGLLAFAGAGLIGFALSNRDNGTFEVVPESVSSISTEPETPNGTQGSSTEAGTLPAPSATQATISVPDLVGKTETQAKEIIKAKSLAPDITTGFSEAFEAQQVMSQYPAVGSAVAKGAPVKIRISLGPNVAEKKRLAELKKLREERAAALQAEKQAEAADTEAILATVDSWRQAWERQDVDAYMSHYSNDATIFGNSKRYSYSEYYDHERELFSHGGTIKVTRMPAGVDIEGDRAKVNFRMTFQRWGGRGDYKSRGRQKFVMRKVDGRWLIENDNFSKS